MVRSIMSVPIEQVAISLSFWQLTQDVAGPLDGAPRVDDDLGVLRPGQLLFPGGGPRVVQNDTCRTGSAAPGGASPSAERGRRRG